jgi:hypothetical protein
MGFMDKITGAAEEHKDKVADAVDQHADKIDQGIGQASSFVDEKTGGRFSDQLDQGEEKVREGLDGLDGEQDDFTQPGAQPR